MAQLFHPAMNVVGRSILPLTVAALAALAWGGLEWKKSAWSTRIGMAIHQEVPFSHEHHVRGLGLDCRYCHTGVETSPYAGLPPTKTCMTCHSEIWRDAPMLQPVRESWRADQPMRWNRVNNLPGYVFFNHAAHIQKGVGCSSCHGNVEQMPLMMQAASLQMEWCLSCHREPERFLRPRDQVFNISYREPGNQVELGKALCKQYDVLPHDLMESCSLCHR